MIGLQRFEEGGPWVAFFVAELSTLYSVMRLVQKIKPDSNGARPRMTSKCFATCLVVLPAVCFSGKLRN
ncbi:hypothetical protein AGR9A_Lc50015 [Agrobacterium salinitolerans str. Hayward 0363]|nr:hypothetical protein AGR9A_Lc50015 [Agrobacterium salinitolerans str. Hayward 0363]